jgi:hypothetical protein
MKIELEAPSLVSKFVYVQIIEVPFSTIIFIQYMRQAKIFGKDNIFFLLNAIHHALSIRFIKIM